MIMQTPSTQASFPLLFHVNDNRWLHLQTAFASAIRELAANDYEQYRDSRQAVERYFVQVAILDGQPPIVSDHDAKAILDAIFYAEEQVVHQADTDEEAVRRIGRHTREFFADHLLEKHLQYLDDADARGVEGARELAHCLGMQDRFSTDKAHMRFMKKIAIYREVRSFVHLPELSLSSVKIRKRAGSRAQRGNLWSYDRRQKYEYLEGLADENKVCPAFSEADLEFLISQSSLEMLQKKTSLLLEEIGYVEPNRLKANYSRLRDHLQRSKQRMSDYQRRRELLLKLGANEQQIDYISARATYQTMENLMKLADGNLAISDLMGGKRTIRKLLRRKGKAQSDAELGLIQYLTEVEGISKRIATAYARTRKNHSMEHLKETVHFLKENYRHFYREQWGFAIKEPILRRALELGLSRNRLSKRSLSAKDFLADLRRASSEEEAKMVLEQDNMDPQLRRSVLAPLREVLDYETDTDTRKQLFFIYEQFCQHGLCIPKDKLKQVCLENKHLFTSQRKVQDALEILNGAYHALGQHGEVLCILPDYLDMPELHQSLQNQNLQSKQGSQIKKTKPALPTSS